MERTRFLLFFARKEKGEWGRRTISHTLRRREKGGEERGGKGDTGEVGGTFSRSRSRIGEKKKKARKTTSSSVIL